MPFPSRLLLGLSVATGVLLLALPARAERTQSDLVIVRPDDVITEDLYAAGNTISVEGRIEGDLYAVAFNSVTISGEVTGDVVAVAGRVEVTGVVGGSLRAVSPKVVVEGDVADDVLVASWETRLERAGRVGRDLLTWSMRAGVDGDVARNLAGQVRSVILTGAVAGGVDLVVDRLTVASTARIDGDLIYQSKRPAEIGEAEIGGNIIQRTALPPNVRLRGLRLLAYTLAVLGVGALAMMLCWAWPKRVEAAVSSARDLVPSWVTGFAVVVSPLLAGGVLAVVVGLSPPEAGVPLALVLVPLVLGLGGMVVILGLLGTVPVAGLVGRVLIKRRSVAAAVLLGWVGISAALLVPVLGLLVLAALVPLGIGAWLRHFELAADLPGPGSR